MKVQVDQIEIGVTDERLDMESDDMLHEGNPVRFGIIPPGVGVNMAFSLPVVFRVGSKENKCPDDSDRPASQDDQTKERSKVLILRNKIKEGENDEDVPTKVVFEKPNWNAANHIKPLYIKAHMKGMPVNRILVDNGAAVNILPSAMLKKLGKQEHDLLPTEFIATKFTGGVTKAKGILSIDLRVYNLTSRRHSLCSKLQHHTTL